MELRKHPRMRWRGRCNWPPQWKGLHRPDQPLPELEVGDLIRIEPGAGDERTPHCFLDLRWNDQEYYAVLFFDDQEFLKLFCETLGRFIGRPIAEIGSLDLP